MAKSTFFWHFFHLGYYNVKFYPSLNWNILFVSCRDYWKTERFLLWKKNNCTFFRIYPHCVCLWQSWCCRCKILQVKKKSLQHPRNMRILASFECMHKIKWKSQNIFEKICLSLYLFCKKKKARNYCCKFIFVLVKSGNSKLIGFFAHFSKTQSHILVGEKSSLCITSNQQNISKFEFWNLDCARKGLLR